MDLTPLPNESTHLLCGSHGELAVRSVGAMIAPVRFRLADGSTWQPMYVAPWCDEAAAAAIEPPMLRGLRGDWLCAPFGPERAPPDLPAGWRARPPSRWDHGYASNHAWTLQHRDDRSLRLAIDLPADEPLARIERVVRADADAPAFGVETTLHPRVDGVLPVALHPTFAVPAGGLELRPSRYRAVHTYPVPPAAGVSQLRPGTVDARLQSLPAIDGSTLDATRLPLPHDTEELLQLEDCEPPFVLRDRARGLDLVLEWDASQLPDVMLWISQRGRRHAPWNGRNVALGVEPCASCFDLSRVADAPASHPLARRRGLSLRAGQPLTLRHRLSVRSANDAR